MMKAVEVTFDMEDSRRQSAVSTAKVAQSTSIRPSSKFNGAQYLFVLLYLSHSTSDVDLVRNASTRTFSNLNDCFDVC